MQIHAIPTHSHIHMDSRDANIQRKNAKQYQGNKQNKIE